MAEHKTWEQEGRGSAERERAGDCEGAARLPDPRWAKSRDLILQDFKQKKAGSAVLERPTT